jgi:two-component system, LuxR family, response regulator FixJ
VSSARSARVAMAGEDAGCERNRTERRGRRVHIVDDDAWVSDSLVALLETYGFEAIAHASGTALLADPRHREMGCLIIDQQMPGMSGLEVLMALQCKAVFVPAILIGGRLDAVSVERAAKLGVIAVLEKPFTGARLVGLVRAGLERPC